MTELQQIIEAAFERRDTITPGSVDSATKSAILQAIDAQAIACIATVVAAILRERRQARRIAPRGRQPRRSQRRGEPVAAGDE